jgi:hypothetical protein
VAKKKAYLAALNANAKSAIDVEATVEFELPDELDLTPLFAESDSNIQFCSLFITKAVQDSDGTRRIKAVASDTFEDTFGQRMTLSLFQDFLTRIAEDMPAPPPYGSAAWKGGMPYLSVAHYLDQGGQAVVGTPTNVWVDDNHFRFKADMAKSALAEKAWGAIKADIADNVPDEKRVRVSIAFIDWEHVHADGTHFARKSIVEVCPVCIRGAKLKEYVKGQLVHFALTRVPINVRTPIMIERSSVDGVIKSKKDDAAAIVGEDLAEELDKRERGTVVDKSAAAVVIRADAVVTPTPVAVVSVVDAANKPYGGATTLAGALDYITAQRLTWKFSDLFWTVRDVIWNAIDSPMVSEKAAAIEGILGEMQDQFSQEALMALSKVSTPVPVVPVVPTVTSQTEVSTMLKSDHPLAAQLEAIATAYDGVVMKSDLTRTQKFEPIQKALDALGLTIRSAVNASTPTSTADVEETIRRVLGEMLPAFMPASVPVANGSQSPAPRQVQPQAAATFRATAAADAKPNQLRDLARRSVGLPVGEGVPNV